MESYFRHMEDELRLDACFTLRDVCNEIKDYMDIIIIIDINEDWKR